MPGIDGVLVGKAEGGPCAKMSLAKEEEQDEVGEGPAGPHR